MSSSSNIHRSASNSKPETLELSNRALLAQERHSQVLLDLETQRRARTIAVPTLDSDVRTSLRELGYPVTLFGERKEDRRVRLREITARIEILGEEAARPGNEKSTTGEQENVQKEIVYTPASEPLLKARQSIATFSWSRAKDRIAFRKKKKKSVELVEKDAVMIKDKYKELSNVRMRDSQIGSTRPVAACTFSSDFKSKYVATASWSGTCMFYFFSISTFFFSLLVYRGHETRVVDIQFHPSASSCACVATASADSTVKLWSLEADECLRTLRGHQNRLACVRWHPNGSFIGTTSYDHTWRLWDVEYGHEILLQDGIGVAAYALAFHPDGSLACTGDMNGDARLWDMRSGHSPFSMQEHASGVISADFSPSGTLLATTGLDHMYVFTMKSKFFLLLKFPHSKLISTVKFAPVSGEVLLTASYDGTVKLWGTRDWRLLSTLDGHENFVMCADISRSETLFLSSSFDRTWKLWAPENDDEW
eukprot:GSMAST32.ASY1.ANO1.1094.1 assembled CDS